MQVAETYQTAGFERFAVICICGVIYSQNYDFRNSCSNPPYTKRALLLLKFFFKYSDSFYGFTVQYKTNNNTDNYDTYNNT